MALLDTVGRTTYVARSVMATDRVASLALKGAAERAGAALLLLAMVPVFLLLVLAIRIDSKGPALFRQKRVGKDGELFTMLKFRTMCNDAEKMKAALTARNESEGGILFKMRSDPRITRLGALLRRASLDELPQLINVVRGDMSLIGPRPALPDEVAQYDANAHRRHRVKPGLTGLAQVSGRSDLSFEESIAFDLEYVDQWSLAMDLKILRRTVGAVLDQRGAY